MTVPTSNSSIGVKNFLKSFYHFDFYVEKDKRKEGEKVFVYSKDEPLPKKFIEDLYSFKKRIKINGNKAGLFLQEWQEFVKHISGKIYPSKKKKSEEIAEMTDTAKPELPPAATSLFAPDQKMILFQTENSMKEPEQEKGFTALVKERERQEQAIAQKEAALVSIPPVAQTEERITPVYWQLTKKEFKADPPSEVTVADWDGKIRTYILDKDKEGYTVYQDGVAMIAAITESVHEKLLCQALKEGKPLNMEQVTQDYPYLLSKCKAKLASEGEATAQPTVREFSDEGLNEKLSNTEINIGDAVILTRYISLDKPTKVKGTVTEVHENYFVVSYPASPNAADQRPTEVHYQTKEGSTAWQKLHDQKKEVQERNFIALLHESFSQEKKLTKRELTKLAEAEGIRDITRVYELAEYAWIKWYRKIEEESPDVKTAYDRIVEFYTKVQPTFSLRDSVRVEFQQYSTAAPISYLAQVFCNVDQAGLIFEPSAGNGLLVFAAPYERTIVNELDRQRAENLKKDPYKEVLNQDAELPFPALREKADAVLTNPPFGRLTEKIKVDGYNIKVLDHAMITIALQAMKDTGRAAVIIGGHTPFDDNGMIRSFRIFFNWLFHFYHVCDIINIDGDLYAKQGTQFDIRLILIDGRKEKPQGFAPLVKDADHPLRQVVRSFGELYERVHSSMEDPEWIFPKNVPVKVIPGKAAEKKSSEESTPALHQVTLYHYAISTPLNLYEVKKVSEVDLDKEEWYRLAHKARHQGEEYYTVAWKPHYDAVREALEAGTKVSYEIISDYPDLLRLYKDRYKIIDQESRPLTYKEWIKAITVVKGFREVTIFSSMNGEVFFTQNRKEWDKKYENDEPLQEKLYRTLHNKYVNKTLQPVTPLSLQGQLLLIIQQAKISLVVEV